MCYTLEQITEKGNRIHNHQYDYSKVEIGDTRNKKVIIICKNCGKEFLQTLNSHFQGRGCPNCIAKGRKRLTTDEYIRRARSLYGNRFDYSKVSYAGSMDKITIMCNTCGYEFTQSATKHLHTGRCHKCYLRDKRLKKMQDN